MTKQEFLSSFFVSLNREEVYYFVYGSYHELPYDTGGSDIDMVVFESDMEKVETIIENIVDCKNVCIASFYTNSNTKFYRFLSATWGVQLDVFYKGLCYRGVPFFQIENLYDEVVKHNDIVSVLREDRGYYLDFLKECIYNGKVKEKYAKAFLDYYTLNQSKCIIELTNTYNTEVARFIGQNMSFFQLKAITAQLKKMLRESILNGHRITVIVNWAKNVGRIFSKRPGYVIVVEGTDGSGKSFVIDSITPILNECFHNGVVYNHLRPHYIPELGVLFGKKKKRVKHKIVTDPHAQNQSRTIGSLIRWTYYMIDYTLGYMMVVWLKLHTKSKVFIFDRYYHDYYIDQKRSRIRLPKWIIYLGELLIAKPDLILCLGGEPQKIYNRKPETSLEEVRRQTKELMDFCEKHKNAVWIDTTIQPQETVKNVMKEIFNVMNKRFYKK